MPDEPIQQIQLPKKLTQPLIRCEQCAGEAPPPLPFANLGVKPQKFTKRIVPMTRAQLVAAVDRYRSPHNSE